jgi:hypothetical protein
MEPMHMTELEERLAAAGGAALRDELLTRLDSLEWRLRERLAASLPRAEYGRTAESAEAVRAARDVLRDWSAAS